MGLIPKAIGIAGSALLIYDSIKVGVSNGISETKAAMGEHIADTFIAHNTAPNQSELLEEVKSGYRSFLLDGNIFNQFSLVKNVVVSCAKELARDAIPIGLGLTAALLPKRFKILPALSAILLLFSGAKTFVTQVLCVGKDKIT